MFKTLFMTALISLPGLCFSSTTTETFFESLVGSWHGEVQGIWKADIVFDKVDTTKPWALQTGKVDILEGDENFNYQFEISKNESALDKESVYFLKLTNLGSRTSEVFTLASRESKSSHFSFWRHFVEKIGDTELTSANAVKLFVKKEELTWGFVAGNGYCKDSTGSASCQTDGYTPYQLKRIK